MLYTDPRWYWVGVTDNSWFDFLSREAPDRAAKDPFVGCTVLSAPFFLPRDEWIGGEPYWKNNVVVGAYYDSREDRGARLWEEVQVRQALPLVVDPEDERYGKPVLVRPRLGQSGFQVVVTDAYHRRCAISRSTVRRVQGFPPSRAQAAIGE